jgi:hypothetical protein
VREVARGSLCDVCERMYRCLHSADEGGSDKVDDYGLGPMSGEKFERQCVEVEVLWRKSSGLRWCRLSVVDAKACNRATLALKTGSYSSTILSACCPARRQDDKTTQDGTRRRNKEKAATQASEGWGGEERLKRPQQEMQGTCEDARRRVRCSNYSRAKAKIKRLTRGYACTVRRSKRQGPNYSPKAEELLTPFPS